MHRANATWAGHPGSGEFLAHGRAVEGLQVAAKEPKLPLRAGGRSCEIIFGTRSPSTSPWYPRSPSGSTCS